MEKMSKKLEKTIKTKLKGTLGIVGVDESQNCFVRINQKHVTKEDQKLIRKETGCINMKFYEINYV